MYQFDSVGVNDFISNLIRLLSDNGFTVDTMSTKDNLVIGITYTGDSTGADIIVSGFNTLSISAVNNTFTAPVPNDTQCRIDAWDSVGDYALQNETIDVVGGVASYTFNSNIPGVYRFRVIGVQSKQSGFCEVVIL